MKLILTQISDSHRIQSIKAVRAATSMSLKEALTAVDALVKDYSAARTSSRPADWGPERDEYTLLSGLTRQTAENALATLREGEWANGRVESEEVDQSSEDQTIMATALLADAIALARSTDALPSAIIRQITGVSHAV